MAHNTGTPSTDFDEDGCRDMDEDDNDDNDPYLDVYDDCPTGVIGWTGAATITIRMASGPRGRLRR